MAGGSVSSKRRETEVFSLAFLDCICCGFGAVILVFILTIAQKKDVDKADVDAARAQSHGRANAIAMTKDELDRLAKVLAAAQIELDDINAKNAIDETRLSERQRALLLLLQETGALKDALSNLLGEKKTLPTDEIAPIPIPNVDRRQYLTGVKLTGRHIVFVLRCSGSMLDETIDGAAARLGDTDEQKRTAPKWRRTIQAMEWMLANLDPNTNYQILVFNEETNSILPKRGDEWFKTSDRATTTEVLARLNELVPKGGANLERAFTQIRFLPQMPDSVILLTDGLPTRSDSIPIDTEVDELTRIRFFEIAAKTLPPRVPVSTILFPLLTGDPGAPGLYWELANQTRGALVSPSKSWPDT